MTLIASKQKKETLAACLKGRARYTRALKVSIIGNAVIIMLDGFLPVIVQGKIYCCANFCCHANFSNVLYQTFRGEGKRSSGIRKRLSGAPPGRKLGLNNFAFREKSAHPNCFCLYSDRNDQTKESTSKVIVEMEK